MRLAGLIIVGVGMLVAPVIAGDAAGTDVGGEPQEEQRMNAGTFAGLKLRSIGPALMSGRVGDFAVDPNNKQHYYVAVCCGNVWKTTNGGITFTPVFDNQGSFSIGCVTMDPHDSNVVWVGTGENNSQRSVSFGDGVYLTRDGGKNWTNMGLEDSEHIGMIAIDPRDSNVVYVAAQGPLWRDGPQRGLYKTINGGKTWTNILHISGMTGVNEVHLDPRNPDVVYATTYQRRRHVWTLIDGGPESTIYKSTDAGATWRMMTNGIPEGDKGRIGLAVSPANPDVIYAIIEATEKNGGIFRSTDRGETWEKRNDYVSDSPQYYNELVADPHNVDRFYSLDTFMHVSEDGGKTLKRAPRKNRHVDDHALWIDPDNVDHMLVGCDGGVYESYDRGANWHYKVNLPVTQFYRIHADDSKPFYYVYGGTQDNNTVGAPSRTTDRIGVANEHWFVTVGGDGYETQVDPDDPNIVYSQWQYGGLVRYNRQTGEQVDIKPRELPGEPAYRWNWDSPIIISPHKKERLYFACQKLFRSDDRGNSWTAISDDLSRQLDRDQLKVMGKIQLADAVAKHWNTSWYGNCVALSESPLVEGLIYLGTDDGLIQVTEDGGKNWREIDAVLGVPELSYVSCLTASRHDADTVYATFDNHKFGDFKPYVYASTDRGRTWSKISGDLPDRDIVYSLMEDHVKPELLFVGTEFGAYFTVDGGEKWIKLTGDMPTISVRDVDIQRRENDVVLGTFGRGIYILDDYTPIRWASEKLLAQDAVLFPVKDALWYVPSNRLGGRDGRGSQGASFFATPNPPFGAIFTYYLKDKLKTRKEARHEAEQEAEKAGRTPPYPTIEALQAEDEEREPRIIFTVRDDRGDVVQRVVGSREKGLHRVAWNLRYPAYTPTSLSSPGEKDPWWEPPAGPLATPGKYTVSMAKEVDGVVTPLATPAEFNVVPLYGKLRNPGHAKARAFQQKIGELQRAVQGAQRAAGEAQQRINHIRQAVLDTPAADTEVLVEIEGLQQRLNNLLVELRGNPTRNRRQVPVSPSITQRVDDVVWNQWYTTTPPTQTQRDAYEHAGQAFGKVLGELRTLMEQDLKRLEDKLEDADAPWTPGRIPDWKPE